LVVVFLNKKFKGGETNFYYDQEDQNGYELFKSVKPDIGLGAIFDRTILHCGCEVENLDDSDEVCYKYLIRTDVMVGL
jgi:hypothetical protein